MTDVLKCRLAARCEAAGRPNNEDNYNVIADIIKGSGFKGDEIINLGNKGALLLVCDGMGGMNAGEVASEIAVNTIKQWFEASHIDENVLANDSARCDYIKKAIQDADANIKNEGRIDASKSGMGSTVVMAWLLYDKAYVGWCGDSRAYKYNPQSGLMQMSHDHSYVQELVDAGKLAPELAFDHPNGNIITRSLGDPRGVAQPDVKVFQLAENDIILLCSDGLCGVLRNNEIETIIKSNTNSMNGCRDALWEAASNARWHDNVTIVLAQIMPKETETAKEQHEKKDSSQTATGIKDKNKKLLKLLAIAGAALVAVILIIMACFKLGSEDGLHRPETTNPCDDIQLKENVISFCNINTGDLTIDDFSKVSKTDDIKKCDSLNSMLVNYLNNCSYKLTNSSLDGTENVKDKCNEVLEKLKQ